MKPTFSPSPSGVAEENSWRFPASPLVSPANDVLELSAEIPYWWRVTNQILYFFVAFVAWSYGDCSEPVWSNKW